MIMDKQPLDKAIAALVDFIKNVYDGKLDHDDFLIIRQLGANLSSELFYESLC